MVPIVGKKKATAGGGWFGLLGQQGGLTDCLQL